MRYIKVVFGFDTLDILEFDDNVSEKEILEEVEDCIAEYVESQIGFYEVDEKGEDLE